MTSIARGSAIDVVAKAMSEAELQQAILDLCGFLGILAFHSGDSRRDSCAGFPDLVLVGSKRTIYRELKRETTRPTLDQQRWLSRLVRSGQDASTFDRADNTARLALELAEAMREIARLREDADIVEADLREVESDARTQRERAEVAEAKVKAVEALRARYEERTENGCPVSLNYARAHRDLTTALGGGE